MEITLLDLSALLYILLGSTSIGYLLIRTGWPSVRTLEHPYKVGSSIAAAIIFTILTAIFSLIFSIIFPQQMPFFHYIFLSMTAVFFAIFILMLLKQKFVFKRTVKVSVPKEDIAAKIAAEAAVKRVIPEEEFISVRRELSQQQLNEIKKSLKQDAQQSQQETAQEKQKEKEEE